MSILVGSKVALSVIMEKTGLDRPSRLETRAKESISVASRTIYMVRRNESEPANTEKAVGMGPERW